MGTANESPSAAFGLALAGGIIIVLGGLLVSALGAAMTFFIMESEEYSAWSARSGES